MNGWASMTEQEKKDLEDLRRIASSGRMLPVIWCGMLRLIPGYDKDQANLLEAQMFGPDGHPRHTEPPNS